MSRFNTRSTGIGASSPVSTAQLGAYGLGGLIAGRSGVGKSTAVPNATTALGGAGFARDARSELFLLAVSSMVSAGGNFHEGAEERDQRMIELIEQVASDTDWIIGFVRFLREQANLRTVSLVIAAHAVHYRLAAGITGNRAIVTAALQRPDEPAEFIAYWNTAFGQRSDGKHSALPMPVKRGISDALGRLYTERNAIKYDTASKGIRFSDVLRATHAPSKLVGHDALFDWLTKGTRAEELPMVSARIELGKLPVEQRRAVTAGQLKEAGMTWEAYSSFIQEGPMDARAWETVIPLMGYMALLRNLRNFDQAGISKASARLVEDVLTDPAQVARSRQLPMRFLSAYRATRDSGTVTAWGPTLEQALNLSLRNVPSLTGRTLVLVDLSYSMYQSKMSDKSGLRYVDAAAIFGAAVARSAEHADLWAFGSEPRPYEFTARDSLLPLSDRLVNTTCNLPGHPNLPGLGNTDTVLALRTAFRPGVHDRIVIVTDEQYTGASRFRGSAYDGRLEEINTLLDGFGVPVYTWNLAGYRIAQAVSGMERKHTFGGLSDSAFRMIPLLEAGRSQNWADLFAVPLQAEPV